MIAIIDYGLGNLYSVLNMHRRLGIEAIITSDQNEIRAASKLILPGVGHFKRGMENLHQSELKPLLDELVLQEKKPILGICLGAQLLTEHSEEGDVNGLGWVDAVTVKFKQDKLNGLKVPHMGWSDIAIKRGDKILSDLPAEPRFYHVHSYHFLFKESSEVIATATYGYEFACAFQKENIYGVQFHPEKSHKYGMKLLQNFSKL
ncbi:MAG TPA: imidazole glycerol phosphate synthase subunit HisH [Ferruginibacter sp.]|jgi:glutamine amidotransferase|nr:imidazole glycerol phosphate synthase subunit HisH [Ferruginibacter sp.]